MSVNLGQENFIKTTGKNILVSASAGSGKTTTMIKKLLYLITEKNVSIKNILVLTFTEAAASEMKDRLYSSLLKTVSLKQDELNGFAKDSHEYKETLKELEKLYESLEDINYADIGTFHGIFKRKISKYFYELEIDPAFSLIDEQEQKILLQNAITKVFDKYVVSEDEEFYALSEMFNKKRKTLAFKDLITNLYGVSREKIGFKDWYLESLNNSYDTDFNNNKSVNYLKDYIKDSILSYKNRFKFYIKEAESYQFDKVKAVLDQCLLHINLVESKSDFISLSKELFDFKIEGRMDFPRNITADYFDLRDSIKSLYENYKKTVSKMQELAVSSDEEYLKTAFLETKSMLIKLFDVLDYVDKEYTKQKTKKSYLDFNDLQSYMYELTNNPVIAKEISDSYEFIFLDEFQDVNELQYKIIKNISKPDNLNMIGDVKQSIYEFRLANPKIFLDIYDEYTVENNSLGQVIELNKNYRSSNYVLQFSNYLFDYLITTDTVGIDYKNSAMLEAGNEGLINFDKQISDTEINNIRFNVIVNEKTGEESDSVTDSEIGEESLSKHEAEAEIVAKEILSLIGKPYFNTKSGKTDKLDFKDIAILTQDGNEFVNVLSEVLQKYKIPSFVTVKSSIFKTHEVMLLLSYLKLLNNQIDDYSLTTLLKSKMGGLSFNELSKIRLLLNKRKISYFECVQLLLNSEFENDSEYNEIKLKVQSFYNSLDNYKYQLKFKPISDIINSFLHDYDYINNFKSMPDGLYKINNINEFLKIVSTKSFEYNLTELISYLTELQNKEDFRINITSSQNSVSVLTMHKSKGLEYPAVILTQFGKSFNNEVAKSDLIISQNMGLGIRHKNINSRIQKRSVQFSANLIESKSTEHKEKIRLLYVATTRAKNYLSIVGTVNENAFDSLQFKRVSDTNSFMEMSLKVLLEKNNDINLRTSQVINKGSSDEFLYNVIKSSDIKMQEVLVSDFALNDKVNFELINKLSHMHSYEYEIKDNVAIKNTVSSLLSENDYVHKVSTPKSLKTTDYEDIVLISQLYGNAMHDIMQRLNYTETDTEILEIINDVVFNSQNSSEVFDLISASSIKNAINTVKPLLQNSLSYYKEKQFIFKDNYSALIKHSDITQEVIVQGVVDLLIFKSDYAIVLDFKSNKNMTKNAFIDKYKLQLDLYGHAVSEAFSVNNVKKYIYSFELNELIEV